MNLNCLKEIDNKNRKQEENLVTFPLAFSLSFVPHFRFLAGDIIGRCFVWVIFKRFLITRKVTVGTFFYEFTFEFVRIFINSHFLTSLVLS